MSTALEQSRRPEVPGSSGPLPEERRPDDAGRAPAAEPRLVMEDLMDALLACVRSGERE